MRAGVRAVWLGPIYPSPGRDFGYDVSDYTAINPLFGTMDDFDALVRAMRGAGLQGALRCGCVAPVIREHGASRLRARKRRSAR